MFFGGMLSFNEEVVITSMRHKQALEEARDSLPYGEEKPGGMRCRRTLYSIDLMSAYASLGLIIGEEVGEDLVNEIFSKVLYG